MERIPVQSSDIRSVGYDSKTETLEVEFVSKSIYQYFRVPEDVYEGLMNASSKGGYFAKAIKDNRYYGCNQVSPKLRMLRL